MKESNAIGIDPDSQGFVCAYVKRSDAKVSVRGYLTTDADLKSFLQWVKGEKNVVVAIEGSNGLSKPLEKALREAEVIFYSFKPADTDKFRKAVLGQNKNNKKDAESVARYAMALEAQGKLGRYRRVWFADQELQLLTRAYERNSQELTAEVNRLWKTIRLASPDFYLALRGGHPEVELGEKVLKSHGILTLLSAKPDFGEWKHLCDEELVEAMGGRNRKWRSMVIQKLRNVMGSFNPVSPALALMIRSSAQKIEKLKHDRLEITKILAVLTKDRAAVKVLQETRGISTITAATMVAEIVDIRRFAREDSLACYCGLGMREHSTGESVRMVPTELFNHRLKDIFMTAAWNVVHYNPESHVAGYHRNLIKAGKSPLAATKRVARALVRVIYRKLFTLVGEITTAPTEDENKEGESDMASGSTRGGQSHTSDISLSSRGNYRAADAKRVKKGAAPIERSKEPRRKGKPLEKRFGAARAGPL